MPLASDEDLKWRNVNYCFPAFLLCEPVIPQTCKYVLEAVQFMPDYMDSHHVSHLPGEKVMYLGGSCKLFYNLLSVIEPVPIYF